MTLAADERSKSLVKRLFTCSAASWGACPKWMTYLPASVKSSFPKPWKLRSISASTPACSAAPLSASQTYNSFSQCVSPSHPGRERRGNWGNRHAL